jgi:hypothetical protein
MLSLENSYLRSRITRLEAQLKFDWASKKLLEAIVANNEEKKNDAIRQLSSLRSEFLKAVAYECQMEAKLKSHINL